MALMRTRAWAASWVAPGTADDQIGANLERRSDTIIQKVAVEEEFLAQ
jgi:hypothetical protein